MNDSEGKADGALVTRREFSEVSDRLLKIEVYFRVAIAFLTLLSAGGIWGLQELIEVTRTISNVEGQVDEVEGRAKEIHQLLPDLEGELGDLKVDTVRANQAAERAQDRITAHTADSVLKLSSESDHRKSELGEQTRELLTQLESDRREALEEMRERHEESLAALKSARRSAIELARQEIQMSLRAATQDISWNDCVWGDVGIDKSHYPESGAWCPPGKFVTQLDLGRRGFKDFVEKVQCCSIRYDHSDLRQAPEADDLALELERARPEVIADASGG